MPITGPTCHTPDLSRRICNGSAPERGQGTLRPRTSRAASLPAGARRRAAKSGSFPKRRRSQWPAVFRMRAASGWSAGTYKVERPAPLSTSTGKSEHLAFVCMPHATCWLLWSLLADIALVSYVGGHQVATVPSVRGTIIRKAAACCKPAEGQSVRHAIGGRRCWTPRLL